MDEEQYIYNNEQTFSNQKDIFLETPALPIDKRLILEIVSIRMVLSSSLAERGVGTYAIIITTANGEESTYDLPFTDISPKWTYIHETELYSRTFIASYQTKIYADAGSTIRIEVKNIRVKYISGTVKTSLSGTLVKL